MSLDLVFTYWRSSGVWKRKEGFLVSSEVVDGITVNAYYYPEDEEGGKAILRYAADAMQVYNQYYQRYKYRVATGEGFLAVAEEVAGRELDDLYDQWVR